MFDGANFFGGPSYEPLDLFHYSAPGVRDFSGATPGYFSPDGGVTNLNNFNTNGGGDYGDWAGSAGNDAFLAFSSPGVVNGVSANDLTEMNLLGWMPAGAAAAPAVTIALADDTSGGKNVTSNDALTGTADGGATVTLTEGSTVLGTTIAATNGAWSFSPAALPQGLQTVTVSETNGAGVTGSASLSFTFDTIAPNAPAISSDVINGDDSVTLAGTAEANAIVTVFDNAIALGTTLCSAGGLWNFTTAPLSEGTQSFTATATDLAGNCSAPSAAVDPVIAAPAPTVTATPDYTHVLLDGSVSALAAAGVLANDTDSNPADVLTVSAVNGSTANVGQSINGSYGALTMQADGGYSYTNTNADAAAALGGVSEDSFTYTVSDGNGGSADSVLTVLITSPTQTYVTGASGSTITAGKGNYVLDGTAGDMTLTAGNKGTQWLVGADGDTLIGKSSNDTFLFPPNFGNETVNGFNTRHDVIDLPQSEFVDFAAVQADLHAVNHNVVLTLDASDSITLTHLSLQSLHSQNFHFF